MPLSTTTSQSRARAHRASEHRARAQLRFAANQSSLLALNACVQEVEARLAALNVKLADMQVGRGAFSVCSLTTSLTAGGP